MTHFTINRKPLEATLNHLVDDLFSGMPGVFTNDFNKSVRKSFIPANVLESEKGYRVEIVAPGFEKADFEIRIEGNQLTISAKKEVNEQQGTEKLIRREYAFGSFKRSFTIDEKIDATQIEASYVNGVLVLNLPRKEEVKPPVNKIEVR
jgi:HSP20 family protein